MEDTTVNVGAYTKKKKKKLKMEADEEVLRVAAVSGNRHAP